MDNEFLIKKNLNGLNVSYQNSINPLFEKYGILDRDSLFKEKLRQLAFICSKQTMLYDKYEHADKISNITDWLEELTISINYDYDFAAVFDFYDNFKLNNNKDKVISATIKINPKNMVPLDLYAALYHEIKHIYDYLILKTDTALKENLFRDLIYKNEFEYLTQYQEYLVESFDMTDIMNFIANTLYYVEKSECSAYLENIDQDYNDTLNDNQLITSLIYKGYKLEHIKQILFYNIATTNYLKIYSTISLYLNDLLTINSDIMNEINSEYSNIFKEVYNVKSFKDVISIYLKRIDKVKKQSMKLFNDRFETSTFNKIFYIHK